MSWACWVEPDHRKTRQRDIRPNLLTKGESRITNAGMGPNESYGNAQSPPVFKCVRVGIFSCLSIAECFILFGFFEMWMPACTV
jgi:hypothetical protein